MVNETAGARQPKVPLIREIKLFGRFTDTELSDLAFSGKTVHFEEHSNIVIEGELSWGLYVIIQGSVGIFKNNPGTGESYDVGQLTVGNFFGEMSLIDEAPRSATVKAMSPVSLFYIPKDSFQDFLNKSDELRARFYQNCVETLVGRLRLLDDSYVTSQYLLWKRALKKETA